MDWPVPTTAVSQSVKRDARHDHDWLKRAVMPSRVQVWVGGYLIGRRRRTEMLAFTLHGERAAAGDLRVLLLVAEAVEETADYW
jgi:hypothetical protein